MGAADRWAWSCEGSGTQRPLGWAWGSKKPLLLGGGTSSRDSRQHRTATNSQTFSTSRASTPSVALHALVRCPTDLASTAIHAGTAHTAKLGGSCESQPLAPRALWAVLCGLSRRWLRPPPGMAAGGLAWGAHNLKRLLAPHSSFHSAFAGGKPRRRNHRALLLVDLAEDRLDGLLPLAWQALPSSLASSGIDGGAPPVAAGCRRLAVLVGLPWRPCLPGGISSSGRWDRGQAGGQVAVVHRQSRPAASQAAGGCRRRQASRRWRPASGQPLLPASMLPGH